MRTTAPSATITGSGSMTTSSASDLHARKASLPAPAVDRHRSNTKVFGYLLHAEQLPQQLLLHAPLSPSIDNPVGLDPPYNTFQCVLEHLTVLECTFSALECTTVMSQLAQTSTEGAQ